MWKRYIAGITATATLGAGGVTVADRQANPYEDKDTHYELPIKAEIPQGERVEIAKDKAQMTLKGWNDEYAITITPQIPTAAFGAIDRPFTTPADRKLLLKKMEYREGDVTAFIEPKEGTDNEFDIDFTLHSKPDTNVFTYKIEGAEEFDFFYQPELTPEEIAEGAQRPENVVGSYAVYHKTKANHRVGDTNYATGKAFHIYRPKAIDANGDEILASLQYNNGILAVVVHPDWLEKATYPVVVDPTFGYASVGASQIDATDDFYGTRHTAPGDMGTVTGGNIACQRGSGAPLAKVVVVLQSTLNIVTNGVSNASPTCTGATFKAVTFATAPTLSASTDYVLGGITNGGGAADTIYYDTGGTTNYGYLDLTNSYATPTNPTDATNNDNRYSVYLDYTASGGAVDDSRAPGDAFFD